MNRWLAFVPFVIVLAGCSSLLDVDFDNFNKPDGGSVSPDGGAPQQCATCASLGACGIQNDGCGNTLDCGTTCQQANYACNGQSCVCTPKTCTDLAVQCGTVDDGCGHSLDCGTCGASLECVQNQCKCVAKTCADYNNPACGTYPTGCGTDTINCGSPCSGNTPNCTNGTCTAKPCTPQTCSDLGNPCDSEPDGCGGTVGPCTTCKSPDSCGGGGTAHVCGCTAMTCAQAGNPCDAVANGCGGSVGPCTTCTSPQTCGGGGTANVCGCTPTGTCPGGANCGTVPNGCGGNVSCGPNCTSPQTCGGGGTANVCGCTSNGTCSSCCGAGTDNCGKACVGSTCCGGGGGGCFPAGELVTMGDGTTRAIGELRVGDVVMTFDFATHALVPSPVESIDAHGPEASRDGLLVINDRLHVTPNHPIYETSRGGIRADQLRVGDEILDVQGRTVRGEIVKSIVTAPGNVPVLTIAARNHQLFIVSDTVMEEKQ